MAGTNGSTRMMPAEIFGLADRLHVHARHVVLNDLPTIQRDISLAGRLLKHLLEHGLIVAPIDLGR